MPEKFPTLSEIRTLLEVSEARIIAALRAPAPTPAPDPMPDGGAGKIRVAFGFRGPRPLHVGDTGILHGTCEGFDPRKTNAVILDPDNEPIPTADVEVLHNGPVISHDPPYYDTIALVATWTPKKEYAPGSELSFVTGIDTPAVVPLAVTITAALKPPKQAEPAATESLADRWSILLDWPSSWPPVADDGKMPKLPEARDVETLRLYARHGYERDGTPMRGPISLGFAGEAVQDIAEMDEATYGKSRFKGLARDLACYGVLVKRILIPFDRPGADLSSEPITGVAYPSLEALLAREVDMFGPGDNAGPGGKTSGA